jgi:hypothetical protein
MGLVPAGEPVSKLEAAKLIDRAVEEGADARCEHCDAYQSVEPIRAGVWRITVHHDSSCSWLRSRQERRAA